VGKFIVHRNDANFHEIRFAVERVGATSVFGVVFGE
jgi:hypothetical protein